MINGASSNTSPEIPHCLATNTQDQRETTQFSQHSQQQKYFSLSSFIEKPPEGYKGELLLGLGSVIFGEFSITRPIKTDPGLPNFGTSICSPPAMEPGEENFRKRKADNNTFQPSKGQLVDENKGQLVDENKARKAKRCYEEEKFASNKLDATKLDVQNNNSDNIQLQVELAAENSSLDFNIEDLFIKEAYPTCSSNITAMGVSTEMANLEYLNYNSGDLGLSEAEMSIQESTTAPVLVPEAFPDSSSLISCLPWEQSDLQNIYNMEFQQAGQPFPSQTYTDFAGPF